MAEHWSDARLNYHKAGLALRLSKGRVRGVPFSEAHWNVYTDLARWLNVHDDGMICLAWEGSLPMTPYPYARTSCRRGLPGHVIPVEFTMPLIPEAGKGTRTPDILLGNFVVSQAGAE